MLSIATIVTGVAVAGALRRCCSSKSAPSPAATKNITSAVRAIWSGERRLSRAGRHNGGLGW
jgi:hypothetical protein